MDDTEFMQNITVQYCFPDNNSSCKKEVKSGAGNIFLFIGKMACSVYLVISLVSMSGSLSSLILIAVDWYTAVCDPLLYSTRVTVCKTLLFIILGWTFCLSYVILYLYFNNHFLQSQLSTVCYGECVLVIKYSWVITDLVVSFLAPCSVILALYSIIFKMARRQARTVRAVTNDASHKPQVKVSSSSETKAAEKRGTLIFVYLACWIPFYLSSLSVETLTSSSMVWPVLCWLIYINSSVNPLIYAIFYSWSRKSAKDVLTCGLCQPSSSRFNLFPEH